MPFQRFYCADIEYREYTWDHRKGEKNSFFILEMNSYCLLILYSFQVRHNLSSISGIFIIYIKEEKFLSLSLFIYFYCLKILRLNKTYL
jgi:hypothetical protein